MPSSTSEACAGPVRIATRASPLARWQAGLVAQLLEDAGYRTVEDILREDEEKLAIKTGLGIKKARAIKQGAEHFLSSDAKTIEAARREAVAKAREAAAQPQT